METTNYGHLSRQLKESYDSAEIAHLIPEINRLERIVSALESIGVNLDETDIVALEQLAKDGNGYERMGSSINQTIDEWQHESRDQEAWDTEEVLRKSGFVVNDEDEETWVRDGVTVKIECAHLAESKYKWSIEQDGGGFDSGVSGEFHRLLALISGEVKS